MKNEFELLMQQKSSFLEKSEKKLSVFKEKEMQIIAQNKKEALKLQ